MTAQGKIAFRIGLAYGVLLALGMAYSLCDTFLIPHPASAEESLSSSDEAASGPSETGSETASTSYPDGSSIFSASLPYEATTASLSVGTAADSSGAMTKYYLCDIFLGCYEDLRTRFATDGNGNFGVNITQTVSSQVASAEKEGANVLCAINGDWAYASSVRSGYVIRNGIIYRSAPQNTGGSSAGVTSGDCFAAFKDGSAQAFRESSTTTAELKAEGCWQNWSFGPTLVDEGEIAVSSDEEVAQAKGGNERTAIGYVAPWHFVFFVSEGRLVKKGGSYVDGFSLHEIASILKEHGCLYAYNLDGGGSSVMWFDGWRVNALGESASSERAVGDIIYVTGPQA